MLATTIVAIAETTYVGLLGTMPLAGMALAFPMVMLQQMMSSGAMGGGVSSAIARALGAGEQSRAELLAFHALVIGLLAGLSFTFALVLFGPAIYRALGGRGPELAEALAYSNVLFLGAAAIWLTNTLLSIVRGCGNMTAPSATVLVIAIVQTVFGGGLALGLGPFPQLGMHGLAIGQVLAFSTGGLLLYSYVWRGHCRLRLHFAGMRLSWPMFRDILKVGAVSCFNPVQSVVTVLVVTALVSRFGPQALAGYGIAARFEFLLTAIPFAIGIASVPLVGMAIGAGDVERARRVAWTASAVGAAVLGCGGLFAALAPNAWARLFSADPSVLAAAASYFAWAGPFYPFFAIGMCLYFASQGAGVILPPVMAQGLRLLIVALGGWYLSGKDVQVSAIFALAGVAMAFYGCGTALVVYLACWRPRIARAV